MGCSRWQKAEILVKGSAKAALGWGEGRARELRGWRQREALTSLGLESLGHAPGPQLAPAAPPQLEPGLALRGAAALTPPPPAPSWLLAPGLLREQGQEQEQERDIGTGPGLGTGPGAGPGPARAAQSRPGPAVCSWPPAVCPCLPLAGLPQGSCPHICIFPALPAVIGGSSARLVPALLRAPLLPLPLPAPLAASVLGIFGKVPGAPQTLPGQGCLEEPPRPRSREDRGGRSCQEGRKEPPEEFQSETRPRLPAAALAPAWGLGAGVGSALFGPRHGPEEASGGESPCTAPARCLPQRLLFPRGTGQENLVTGSWVRAAGVWSLWTAQNPACPSAGANPQCSCRAW